MTEMESRGSCGRQSRFRGQRAFIREKVLGLNDKDAALAAGYLLNVAENAKQKIWVKPQVLIESERLLENILNVAMSANPESKELLQAQNPVIGSIRFVSARRC
jgi:hypothetical protein